LIMKTHYSELKYTLKILKVMEVASFIAY
jgi:hypothetical protein